MPALRRYGKTFGVVVTTVGTFVTWFAREAIKTWFFEKVIHTVEGPAMTFAAPLVEYAPPLAFAGATLWLLWRIYKQGQRTAPKQSASQQSEFISLKDAAIKLYDTTRTRSDASLLGAVAERMSGSNDGRIVPGSPNDILDFMATHISRHIAIYGKKAPSTVFGKLKDEELNHARFANGASELRDQLYDKSIFWTDLAVKTRDFGAKLDRMSKLGSPNGRQTARSSPPATGKGKPARSKRR